MIGIYKITSPSGRIYIGQSTSVEKRQEQYLNKSCKGQTRLFRSIKKYGFSEHIFEILEECALEYLNTRERHWQEFYNVLGNKGLNCRLTGTEDKSGHMSESSKQKMSASLRGSRGRIASKETVEKMREAATGRKQTQETKDKRAKSNTGSKRTEDTRHKMSISQLGKQKTDEHRLNISLAKKEYWRKKREDE